MHYWRDYVFEAHGIPTMERRKRAYTSFFERYDERVFCYELYHQVRTLMNVWYDSHNEGQATRLRFQGELRKTTIGELAEEFGRGAVPLSRAYVPDFVLHSPAEFLDQNLVVEGKTRPDLTWSRVSRDLKKLDEFVGRGLGLNRTSLIVNKLRSGANWISPPNCAGATWFP